MEKLEGCVSLWRARWEANEMTVGERGGQVLGMGGRCFTVYFLSKFLFFSYVNMLSEKRF